MFKYFGVVLSKMDTEMLSVVLSYCFSYLTFKTQSAFFPDHYM